MDIILKIIELVYKLTDQYIPSPAKEILLGAFGAALLGGLIYGLIIGFRPKEVQKNSSAGEATVDELDEDTRTPLRTQLHDAQEKIRALENKLVISPLERYYLYFNGIANASLMLAFSVLVDRGLLKSLEEKLPIKAQISSFISILLAGLVTSIIINVLVDMLTARPTRRTDVINRAFLIAFAVNALVFVAYHMNYINV